MRGMIVVLTLVVGSLMTLTACTGCGQQKSPEEIQRETASATAKLKQDTVAVAKGIKDGVTRPKTVDINSASDSELTNTLGVSNEVANKIVAGRPYDNTDQLVTKRVITNAEYDRIKDKIAVKK
jgi:DNA uptake protein ComE-like DNA-binding protein